MAKLPTRRTIFDLVGEAQANRDGSDRQEELARCAPGQRVALEREPRNPYDANAILVVSRRGTGIGYIPRGDAAELAPHLDDGRTARAQIHELTGGMPDYPNIGCRISIAWDDRALPAHKTIRPEQTFVGRGPTPPRAANSSGGIPALIWVPAVILAVMVLVSLF